MADARSSFRFSEKEKEIFVEILKSFPAIKDKAQDSRSLKKKESAWKEITNLFNASEVVSKSYSTKCLKDLNKRLKMQAKKAANLNHRSTGGVAAASPVSPLDLKYGHIIGATLYPLANINELPSPVPSEETIDDPSTYLASVAEGVAVASVSQNGQHETFTSQSSSSWSKKRLECEIKHQNAEHEKKMEILELDKRNKLLDYEILKTKLWRLQQQLLKEGIPSVPENFGPP